MKLHLTNSATTKYVILGIAAFFVLLVLVSLLIRRRDNFENRWKENQRLLAKKATWKDAIIGADKLLDEALKKRRFKGKTMGERLVSAQHSLTSNDMVWFSHKLRNRIVYEGLEVTKTDVKRALLGFWQALKDLGAFKKKDE